MPGINKHLPFSFGEIPGKAYVIHQIFGSCQIFTIFQRLEFNEFYIIVFFIKLHPGGII